MQGFARRHTVAQALAWLDAQLRPLDAERVDLRHAAGRVLAEPIVSDVDVPGFDRATMDGYAVVADDTEGATPYNRAPLRVIGDALPGAPFAGDVGRGEAVRIMTGAPVPPGGDAVLPAEFVETEARRPDRDRRARPVSPGKNVGRRGEDIAPRHDAARGRPRCCGRRTSASSARSGIAEVPVVRRPRVRLVITGNELLPAGSRAARLPDHRRQRTDAGRARRARRRRSSTSRAWCATTPTRFWRRCTPTPTW